MKVATVNNAVKSGQRTVQDWKASGEAFSEALGDGRAAVERFVDQTRDQVEDMVYQASRRVKRNPMAAIAVAFGAGAVLGALMFSRNGRR